MQRDSELPGVRDLLLMAVALHGSHPAVVERERPATANGRAILKQTLVWMGSWNEVTRRSAYVDAQEPPVDHLYKTLIDMCRPSLEDSPIVGFGHLGTDEEEPAWPTYVAFGLTECGREYVESLFKQFPELCAFSDRDD